MRGSRGGSGQTWIEAVCTRSDHARQLVSTGGTVPGIGPGSITHRQVQTTELREAPHNARKWVLRVAGDSVRRMPVVPFAAKHNLGYPRQIFFVVAFHDWLETDGDASGLGHRDRFTALVPLRGLPGRRRNTMRLSARVCCKARSRSSPFPHTCRPWQALDGAPNIARSIMLRVARLGRVCVTCVGAATRVRLRARSFNTPSVAEQCHSWSSGAPGCRAHGSSGLRGGAWRRVMRWRQRSPPQGTATPTPHAAPASSALHAPIAASTVRRRRRRTRRRAEHHAARCRWRLPAAHPPKVRGNAPNLLHRPGRQLAGGGPWRTRCCSTPAVWLNQRPVAAALWCVVRVCPCRGCRAPRGRGADCRSVGQQGLCAGCCRRRVSG